MKQQTLLKSALNSVFKASAQFKGKKSEFKSLESGIERCSQLNVKFQMNIWASHDSWNRVIDKNCVKLMVFWLNLKLFSIQLQNTGNTLRMLRSINNAEKFVEDLMSKETLLSVSL